MVRALQVAELFVLAVPQLVTALQAPLELLALLELLVMTVQLDVVLQALAEPLFAPVPPAPAVLL